MPGVILSGVAEKDGNQFTALCPELDVATCGDTVEEALDMLDDVLQVYIEELVDLGHLDKILQERGVIVRSDIPRKGEEVLVSAHPGKIYRAYVIKIPALAAG